MPTLVLDSPVGLSSESNAYRPVINGLRGSGNRDEIRLETPGREAPTLGASWLAQILARRLADLLQQSSALASVASESVSTFAVFPERAIVFLEDEPLCEIAETLQERSPELARAIAHLMSILESEPVEDGVIHGGERLVQKIIAVHGADALSEVILKTVDSSLAASMLRLFARVAPRDEVIRRRLVEQGLRSDDVEIRDAVVQAVELWEQEDMVHLLAKHEEPVEWLAAYVRHVIGEFEEVEK